MASRTPCQSVRWGRGEAGVGSATAVVTTGRVNWRSAGRRSSVVEQLFCKQLAVGSNPSAGSDREITAWGVSYTPTRKKMFGFTQPRPPPPLPPPPKARGGERGGGGPPPPPLREEAPRPPPPTPKPTAHPPYPPPRAGATPPGGGGDQRSPRDPCRQHRAQPLQSDVALLLLAGGGRGDPRVTDGTDEGASCGHRCSSRAHRGRVAPTAERLRWARLHGAP